MYRQLSCTSIVDAANPTSYRRRRRSGPLPTKASTTAIRAIFSRFDFFGDSPRISLIVVLPYSRGGGGA
jgi:hypothetical protein